MIDRRVTRLILGSFPSAASLAAGQYYAHPRNQFWRLMGDLFGEPLREHPYPRRLQRLLAHRVGLWDVIDACDREGSLDSAITNVRANPFARLERLAPRLHDVAFNGGTAGRFARAFASRRLPHLACCHRPARHTQAGPTSRSLRSGARGGERTDTA